MREKLFLWFANLPWVNRFINWIAPHGIQGERGGWKDEEDPPEKTLQ